MPVRRATTSDRQSILQIDHVAEKDRSRRALLTSALNEKSVFVLIEVENILGFIICRRNFFGRHFVELLYIHSEKRRTGLGNRLLLHVESMVFKQKTELWTSSNQSNRPMRRLLKQRGFVLAGRITGLDDADPEIFYVKKRPQELSTSK